MTAFRLTAKPRDINESLPWILDNLDGQKIKTLIFSRSSALSVPNTKLLAKYVSSLPSLKNLLAPRREIGTTRSKSMFAYLGAHAQFDSGHHLWVQTEAELNIVQAFSQDLKCGNLLYLTLFGLNHTTEQCADILLRNLEPPSGNRLSHLTELSLVNMPLKRMSGKVPGQSLKRLEIRDCGDVTSFLLSLADEHLQIHGFLLSAVTLASAPSSKYSKAIEAFVTSCPNVQHLYLENMHKSSRLLKMSIKLLTPTMRTFSVRFGEMRIRGKELSQFNLIAEPDNANSFKDLSALGIEIPSVTSMFESPEIYNSAPYKLDIRKVAVGVIP